MKEEFYHIDSNGSRSKVLSDFISFYNSQFKKGKTVDEVFNVDMELLNNEN